MSTRLDADAMHDHGVDVVGHASAEAPAELPDRSPEKRRASSYADPLSWLVFDAVEDALSQDAGHVDVRRTGHIVTSETCTLHTVRGLIDGARRGRISPLRFSGSSPGSLCSLPFQILGLHGPSLTLSMPADSGERIAAILAAAWLRRRTVERAIVSCHRSGSYGHRVSTTVFARAQASES